jgi:hypothetical protein
MLPLQAFFSPSTFSSLSSQSKQAFTFASSPLALFALLS